MVVMDPKKIKNKNILDVINEVIDNLSSFKEDKNLEGDSKKLKEKLEERIIKD